MKHLARTWSCAALITACDLQGPITSGADGGFDQGTRDGRLDVSSDHVRTDIVFDQVTLSPLNGLSPNDVSILFPAVEELLVAGTEASGGPILPEEVFDLIAEPLTESPGPYYPRLTVAAARFDPCSQSSFADRCQFQIRLVLQTRETTSEFENGAVHLLFDVPESEVPEVISGLVETSQLGPQNQGMSLRVSPALSAQGMGSPYALSLRRLILAHIGPRNLSRMTFMTRSGSNVPVWHFGGFLFATGQSASASNATAIIIAGVGGATQEVAGIERLETQFADPVGQSGVSRALISGLALAELSALRNWYARLEDPDSHLADTTDCASCHLAGIVRANVEQSSGQSREDYLNFYAPHERSPDFVGADLRSFGYFEGRPIINQRTANETAAVLAQL